MRRSFCIICGIYLLTPWFVFGGVSYPGVENQKISITVGNDFDARGEWTLQVNTNDGYSAYGLWEPKDFGFTGVTDYEIIDISDESGSLETTNWGDSVSALNRYKTGPGFRNIFVTYDVTTALKQPVVLYEFFIVGDSYFRSPSISVKFPKNWRVLKSFPEGGVVSDSTFELAYPSLQHGYIFPVLVAFVPSDIGNGNTIKTFGNFTIAGTDSSVKKIQKAIEDMSFLEDFFKKTLGVVLPKEVLIYVSDLTDASVGYEAQALAARPGIILYNKDILEKQSLFEIKSTLLHEVVHLVEHEQAFFKGSPFVAPWFSEGLAVFMENEARDYLSTDEKEKILMDLTGKNRLFTWSELQNKYEYPFDYYFEGNVFYSINDSYTHGGVILKNFYNTLGVDGMQKLFNILKKYTSSASKGADSDSILATMSTLLNNDDRANTIFPFKRKDVTEPKASNLVRGEYDENTDDILVSYIETKVPSYFGTRSGFVEQKKVLTKEIFATSTNHTEVIAADVPKKVFPNDDAKNDSLLVKVASSTKTGAILKEVYVATSAALISANTPSSTLEVYTVDSQKKISFLSRVAGWFLKFFE